MSTKCFVLLHADGYNFDDAEVVGVYRTMKAALEDKNNHDEPGSCVIQESEIS